MPTFSSLMAMSSSPCGAATGFYRGTEPCRSRHPGISLTVSNTCSRMDRCSTWRSASPTAAPPSTGSTSACAPLPRCRWRRRSHSTARWPAPGQHGQRQRFGLPVACSPRHGVRGRGVVRAGRLSPDQRRGRPRVRRRSGPAGPGPDAWVRGGRLPSGRCSTRSTSWPHGRPAVAVSHRPTSAGLAARARSKDAVLVPYVTEANWPGADVRLQARDGMWSGIGQGTGRLRARQVEVTVAGRGSAARPASTSLWVACRRRRRAAVHPARPGDRSGRVTAGQPPEGRAPSCNAVNRASTTMRTSIRSACARS